MDGNDGIPRIASLLADPARARMLALLIDGTTRPAGELAYAANISAQSASAHLAKLVDGGLLAAQAQGRHRYFRLASAQVADAVESLATLSAAVAPRFTAARVASKALPIAFLRARTCYDHLAGELAVQLCADMLKARWLDCEGRDFLVTSSGDKRLGALGVDLESARRSRRVFARACVDLTQRRPHIGGALGAALLEFYVARGWLLRSRRSRAVTVTPKGEDALAHLVR